LIQVYPTDQYRKVTVCVPQSLLEAPLDLEALGLSLHSLLVNPALIPSDVKLYLKLTDVLFSHCRNNVFLSLITVSPQSLQQRPWLIWKIKGLLKHAKHLDVTSNELRFNECCPNTTIHQQLLTEILYPCLSILTVWCTFILPSRLPHRNFW